MSSTKPGFWKPRAAAFALLTITIIAAAWTYLIPGGWLWETPAPKSFPAIRLNVAGDVVKLTLYAEPGSANADFYLADTQGAVREWWLYQTDPITTNDLVSCQGSGRVGQIDKDSMYCAKLGDTIEITFDRSAAPDNETTPGARAPYRELWLLPVHRTSFDTVHAQTAVRWSKVEVNRDKKPRIDAAASTCVDPSNTEERDRCLVVEELFNRPQLLFSRDPQLMVSSIAQTAARRLVPAVITGMIIIDLGLVILLIALAGLWLKGGGLVQRSQRGVIIDASTTWRGVRRMLEWCEVMGPAIAFLLTVAGLLIAFDRSIFADRDGAGFSTAISLAMSATAVGLLMRVLAYSADRLLDYLSHWNAEPNGIVYPGDFRGTVAHPRAQRDSDPDSTNLDEPAERSAERRKPTPAQRSDPAKASPGREAQRDGNVRTTHHEET